MARLSVRAQNRVASSRKCANRDVGLSWEFSSAAAYNTKSIMDTAV